MGLRMDDLHAPTIPSGPTTHAGTNGVAAKKTFQELITGKESLETQLSALGAVLDSHGANMTTSLTTFDGYPRADIDVAQIRTTRAQIVRLKNDHKALMKELEDAVHEQFASAKNTSSVTTTSARTDSRPQQHLPVGQSSTSPPTITPPFARVNAVVPESPADGAGLQAGDLVVKFGYISWTNHERLTKVAQVVQQNEDRQILVKVVRDSTTLDLHLTPRRNWGGRGLLGCHLLPL